MKNNLFRSFTAILILVFSGAAFAIDSKVAGSMNHTVFIDNGNVYAMGLNNFRQSDPNTLLPAPTNPAASSESVRTPVYLGIQNVKSVTASANRSAVLKNDGTIVLWGQLTGKLWTKPMTPVANSAPITDIALSNTALFMVQDGVLYSWGFTGNVTQVIGTGEGRVKNIAAGDKHVVVLFENGTVGTLGMNNNGQLGRGAVTTAVQGHAKLALTDAVEVAANGNTSFVRTSNGKVYGFGKNNYSQLGTGVTGDKLTPVEIPALAGAKKITINFAATYAQMADNTIKAAGFHNYIGGALYNMSKTFETIPGVSGVVDLNAGGQQVYVDLGAVGVLRSWGSNSKGQLGDNTITERHTLTYAHFTRYAAYTAPTPGTCGSIYSNPFGNAGNSNNNGAACNNNGNHNGSSNTGNGNGKKN